MKSGVISQLFDEKNLSIRSMEDRLTEIEQYVVDFVYKLRTQNNHSGEYVGFIIGVSKSFISKVENPKNPAKYNLNHIRLLADHYGISPREFLPL